jgi:hypothetical protein
MASAISTIGSVTVRGIDGTVAFTGMATSANKWVGRSLRKQTTENEALDGNGAVFSKAYMNRRRRATIRIIPFVASGTSTPLAAAQALMLLIDNGATVTIASSGIALWNGTWHVTGEPSLEESNDGSSAVIVMEIEYFIENGTSGTLGAPATITS